MKILIFLIVSFFLVAKSTSSVDEFYSEKEALKWVKIALKEKNILHVETLEIKNLDTKQELVVIYLFNRSGGDNFLRFLLRRVADMKSLII